MRLHKIAPFAAALLCLGAAVPSSPATADEGADLVYVSGPGGPLTGWTVPKLVVRPNDRVTYYNIDAFQHDVVSIDVYGPDTDWCVSAGFAPGTCPLIWSPLIGVGQSTKVYGFENVSPGQRIPFVCTIHGAMKGEVVVVPDAPVEAPAVDSPVSASIDVSIHAEI